MNIPAKKSLGQHFLYNPSTIDKILTVASAGPEDHILEIGPGPGLMTERLCQTAASVVAVEKDHRFAEDLQQRLSKYDRFKMIEGDILDVDFQKILATPPYKVVANLPYNIATVIVDRLFKARELFSSFYLMFQKEVAERLVAKPGSKDFGSLSIMSQLYSENKIMLRLPPGAFRPPPKVSSAIVSFQLQAECRFPIRNMTVFKTVVWAAFSQRRKMIRNNLLKSLPERGRTAVDDVLKQTGVDPKIRAEALPLTKFVEVANALSLRYEGE